MAKNDIAIEALKQNFNKIDRAEGFDANSIERKLRKLENQKINNFDFRKTPPTPEEGQDGSIVFVAGEDSVAMKMMVKNKNRWFSISLPSVMQVADVSSAHTPLKFSPYVVTTTAQGTSGTTAVTCNSAAGTIQYYKATSIAANGVSAFQVNNSFSRTDSIYLLTVQDENAGERVTATYGDRANGSFKIALHNGDTTATDTSEDISVTFVILNGFNGLLEKINQLGNALVRIGELNTNSV